MVDWCSFSIVLLRAYELFESHFLEKEWIGFLTFPSSCVAISSEIFSAFRVAFSFCAFFECGWLRIVNAMETSVMCPSFWFVNEQSIPVQDLVDWSNYASLILHVEKTESCSSSNNQRIGFQIIQFHIEKDLFVKHGWQYIWLSHYYFAGIP